jgi:hypothetical protein
MKFEISHFVQDDNQLVIYLHKTSENTVIPTVGRNLKYLTGH